MHLWNEGDEENQEEYGNVILKSSIVDELFRFESSSKKDKETQLRGIAFLVKQSYLIGAYFSSKPLVGNSGGAFCYKIKVEPGQPLVMKGRWVGVSSETNGDIISSCASWTMVNEG